MPGMGEDEARRRFAAQRVARLATVDEEGRPHLVPVVFAVRESGPGGASALDAEGPGDAEEPGGAGPGGAGPGDEIVTAVDGKPKTTTRLKRLRNIAAHPAVCLLADAYDEDWTRLWWVRADGEARVVPPDAATVSLLRAKYDQYALRPPDGPVIVIAVHRWQGWQG